MIRSDDFEGRDKVRALLVIPSGDDPLGDDPLEGLAFGRPRTRGDCASVPRPCPFVSCPHHNYLSVTATGGIHFAFPDLDPWDLDPASSCSLDVADRGGVTLEAIGEIVNLTRERVRQIEFEGSLHAKINGADLEEFAAMEHEMSGRSEARAVAELQTDLARWRLSESRGDGYDD